MGLCKRFLFLLLFGYFLQICCCKRSHKVKASYGGITIDLKTTKFSPPDQDLHLDDERNFKIKIDKKKKHTSIPVTKPTVTDVRLPRVFVVNLSKEKIRKLKKALRRKKKFKNVHIREDPCKYDPCLHRGICRKDLSRGMSTYVCICPVGYYGGRCQNAVPICGDDPCENGECLSKMDMSLCRCSSSYKDFTCNTAPTGRRSTIFTKLSDSGSPPKPVTHKAKRRLSVSLIVLIVVGVVIFLCCLIHCFRVWSRRKDLQFFHEESIKNGFAEEPPPPGCMNICGQICLETLTGQKQTQDYSKQYGVDMPPLTQQQMNEIIKLVEPHTHKVPDKKESKPGILKPPKSTISKDIVKQGRKPSTTSKQSLVSSKKSLNHVDIMDKCRAISQGSVQHSSNVAFATPGAKRIISKLLPEEKRMSYLESIEQLPPSGKGNKRYYEDDNFDMVESLTEMEYRKPISTSPQKPIRRFVRYHKPDMEESLIELSEVEYRKPLSASPRKPTELFVRYREPDSFAEELPELQHRKPISASPKKPITRNVRYQEPDSFAVELSEVQYRKPINASPKKPITRNVRYEKGFTEMDSRKHVNDVSDTSTFESGSTEKSEFGNIDPYLISSDESVVTGVSTEKSDFDNVDSYLISSGGSTEKSYFDSMDNISSGASVVTGVSTEKSYFDSMDPYLISSGASALTDVSVEDSGILEIPEMRRTRGSQISTIGTGTSAQSTLISEASSRQNWSEGSDMSAGSTKMSDVSSKPSSGSRSGMSAGSTKLSDVSSKPSTGSRSGMSGGANRKQSMSSRSTDKSVSSPPSKNHRKGNERNYESTEKLPVGNVRKLSEYEKGGNESSSATSPIDMKLTENRDDILPVKLSTKKSSKVTFRSFEDQQKDLFNTKPTKKASVENIRMKAVSPSPVRNFQLQPPVTKLNDKSKMTLKALSPDSSSKSKFLTKRQSADNSESKGTKTRNCPRKRSSEDDDGGLAGKIRPLSSSMYPKNTFQQVRTIIKPVSSEVYEDWSFTTVTSTPTSCSTNPSPDKYQKYFDKEAKRRSPTRLDRSKNCKDKLSSTLVNRGPIRVNKRKSSKSKTRKEDDVFSNITNNSRLPESQSPSEVDINPNNSQFDYIAFRGKSCDFEDELSNDSESEGKPDDNELNVDKSCSDVVDRELECHENQDESNEAEETYPDAPEDESPESLPCSPQKHDNSDQLVPNLSIASEDRSTPEPQTLDSMTTNTSEINHLVRTPVDVHMPKDPVDLETSFENLVALEAISEETITLEDSPKIACREDETLNTSWLVPKSPIVHVETENFPDTTANISPERCLSEIMDIKDMSVTIDDLQKALGQTVDNPTQDEPKDELEGDELKNFELEIGTVSPEPVASNSYQEGKDISPREAECDKAEHVDADASIADRGQDTSNGGADLDNVDLNKSLEWPDIEDTEDRQSDSVNATFGSVTIEINELSYELQDVEDQEITFRL